MEDETADVLVVAGDPDRSFQTFLAGFQSDPAWHDAAAMAASYMEGFDAADISTVSVQALLHEQRAREHQHATARLLLRSVRPHRTDYRLPAGLRISHDEQL
jgi:hypothetical protein